MMMFRETVFITMLLLTSLIHVTVQQALVPNPEKDGIQEEDNLKEEDIMKILLTAIQDRGVMEREINELKRQLILMTSRIKKLEDTFGVNVSTDKPTQKQTTTTTSTPATTRRGRVAGCNAPWIQFEEHCFLIKKTKLSWSKASKKCQELNSELASIDSSRKNEFLAEKTNQADYYWIGGHDTEDEGNWYWIGTGDKVGPYTNWRKNDPDGGYSQNCMWFNYDNKPIWIDAPCSRSEYYICEK